MLFLRFLSVHLSVNKGAGIEKSKQKMVLKRV